MRAVTATMAAAGLPGVVTASGPARAQAHEDDYGAWRHHEWREQRWREHQWRERAWHAYAPPPGRLCPTRLLRAAAPLCQAPGLSIRFR